jgi:hypothetical protein
VRPAGCWFCGGEPQPEHQVFVELHRDVEEGLISRRYKATWVTIPRCRRCRFGHQVERVVRWVLIGSAAVTGLMLLAWGASRSSGEAWADEWQLLLPVVWTAFCLLVWRAVRDHRLPWRWLAPRPERYLREHPAIEELVEDGWQY